MPKILKNNTVSGFPIHDVGFYISVFEDFIIDPSDYDKVAGSQDVFSAVSSSSLIVNDGFIDLTIEEGLAFLTLSETAKGIRYQGTSVEAYLDGLSGFSNANFSVKEILPAFTISIPSNQQMIVYQECCVDLTGELEILGELVVIE